MLLKTIFHFQGFYIPKKKKKNLIYPAPVSTLGCEL